MGRILDSNETGMVGTVPKVDLPDLFLKHLLEVESILGIGSVWGDNKEPVIVFRVGKEIRVGEV